jgi:predicted RNase H-like nuclease (RuvC/YqgF family)
MSKYFFLALLSIVLIGCQQEDPNGATTNGGDKDLENKIAQLELDNAMKDSVINESLAFFNEIKSNLESIGVRKDHIRTISENPELAPEDKQWILEEIRHINFLREDNARKVKQLNAELKKNGLKIKELEVMIESLVKEIQWKDEQIEMLQEELASLDQQYSALFDAYQEQSLQIDELTDKLNRVYYAYGSEKEMEENNIIEKKNGFIGIGKKLELRYDFDNDYFTELNFAKTKEITIRGTDLHLITDHPASSYELVENGTSTKIKINDASEFWKISRYLVVIVK